MLQVPQYRGADLTRVEALFLKPLMLDQLRVYRRGTKPVGLISWAWLSEQAEAEYLKSGAIGPEDWQSGSRLWFPDIIAPFGDIKQITRSTRSIIPTGTYGYATRRNADGSVRRIAKYASFNAKLPL